MGQQSFDIVSEIELPEVSNAVVQANKEAGTRYDLKATKTEIELDEAAPKLTIRTQDEFTLKQVVQLLEERLIRRKVPVRALTYGGIQQASGSRVVQEVELQRGIPIEKAREVVKFMKKLNLKKMQASIQGEQVRVSGKSRDDLQQAIAALKEHDFGIDMQFTNFRGN